MVSVLAIATIIFGFYLALVSVPRTRTFDQQDWDELDGDLEEGRW